jgi:hypothetical protein
VLWNLHKQEEAIEEEEEEEEEADIDLVIDLVNQ